MDKKITALETQKRNPDRLNVYLNDEFAFGISKFVAAWLSVGQTISEDKLKELVDQDEREKAYQTALGFIGYKDRTKLEISKRLEKAGFTAEIIQRTISELEDKEYINDQRFAQQWVEIRSESKPRGRYLLMLELKKKGVDESVISEVLVNIPDEEELAREFGKKYIHKLSEVDNEVFVKKMTGALLRKGFSYSVTKEVVGNLLLQRQSIN
jgi:regulatory protein